VVQNRPVAGWNFVNKVMNLGFANAANFLKR